MTTAQSSSPAGNGCSGASRYPTLTTFAPLALASARQAVSNESIDPTTQPPPWKYATVPPVGFSGV